MPPKMSYPVLVGISDIFVDVAAKLLHSIGVGTNIELAFVDGESRRIAIGQCTFSFTQVTSAEVTVLWRIFRRILVKSGFVGR